LLGRLHDVAGGEAALTRGQTPRPFAQLVGPDVELAPDLRDTSARRAPLVQQSHGLTLELFAERATLSPRRLTRFAFQLLPSCCH
jgi:hypothetical protein